MWFSFSMNMRTRLIAALVAAGVLQACGPAEEPTSAPAADPVAATIAPKNKVADRKTAESTRRIRRTSDF